MHLLILATSERVSRQGMATTVWLGLAPLTLFDVVTPLSNFESEILKCESRALNFATEFLRFETFVSRFESELRNCFRVAHDVQSVGDELFDARDQAPGSSESAAGLPLTGPSVSSAMAFRGEGALLP